MDFRILAVLAICLSLYTTEGSPQRALNSLQGPQSQSSGKLVVGSDSSDNPKNAKIMKQINKVNEDGSYTFGYEADDGSFRVETRSKDGVVKGKYGYVDANGQLKVMEYTAGEKSENSERDENDEAIETKTQRPRFPQPVPNPRYLSRQTKSVQSIALPSSNRDQFIAAQTPSGKVTGGKYNDDDEDDKPEEDEQKDVNNGQYFRAIPTSQSASPSPSSPTSGPQADGPRYVPSHQLGLGGGDPQTRYSQGYPGQGQPQQYSPQIQYAGSPQYQFGGPQTYSQSQPQRLSGQSIPSPYSGQQYDEDAFSPGGQGQGPSPGQQQFNFGRPPPNVQLQFRGSPQEEQGQPQYYQPGQSPQYAGFSPNSGSQFGGGRQLPANIQQLQGSQGGQGGERYVPSIDLDGFSEDADEDGYVDEPPNSLTKGGSAQAQQKQGVAVKAVGPGRGPSDAYRPQILGPQGVLQGGQISLGQEQPGLSGGRGQGQPQFIGQPPQLTDAQIQELFQNQPQFQGGSSQQGIPPQYLSQQGFGSPGQAQQFGGPGQAQQFGGFPGQGQFQGFPQQGRPQFLGRPGQGGQSQQFLPQQNPSLQGQYLGSSGQGQNDEQDQFAGFPPQFLPQQGSQQFRPQGQQQYLGQGLPQGQYLQGNPQAGGFPGQGGFSQNPQLSQGFPQLSQGGVQSSGFPFDFNPYGGIPGQGLSGQGQGQIQGFPSQGVPQGLSQQQFAALQAGQGFPGASPGPQSGFAPGLGGGPGQQFLGQQIQQSQGLQLGGGPPRPVQPAGAGASGGLFGDDARKQVASSNKSPSASKSN